MALATDILQFIRGVSHLVVILVLCWFEALERSQPGSLHPAQVPLGT